MSCLRGFGAALCLAAVLHGAPAHATSLVWTTAEEQAGASTAIVLARVGASDVIVTDRDGPGTGTWYTDVTLHVLSTINGEAPKQFNVRIPGGVLADEVHVVPGAPELAPNERIVAIVREVEDRWYFSVLALSVWHVEGSGPNALLSRDLEDVTMFEFDPLGGMVPANSSALEFVTYQQLVDALGPVRMGGQR